MAQTQDGGDRSAHAQRPCDSSLTFHAHSPARPFCKGDGDRWVPGAAADRAAVPRGEGTTPWPAAGRPRCLSSACCRGWDSARPSGGPAACPPPSGGREAGRDTCLHGAPCTRGRPAPSPSGPRGPAPSTVPRGARGHPVGGGRSCFCTRLRDPGGLCVLSCQRTCANGQVTARGAFRGTRTKPANRYVSPSGMRSRLPVFSKRVRAKLEQAALGALAGSGRLHRWPDRVPDRVLGQEAVQGLAAARRPRGQLRGLDGAPGTAGTPLPLAQPHTSYTLRPNVLHPPHTHRTATSRK